MITGGPGNDSLIGTNGNDEIDGAAGNDSLRGGLGNDTLIGGIGLDLMIGGAGNDVYDIDDAKDVAQENANEGIDTVRTAFFSFSLNSASFVNVENLQFLAGAVQGLGNAHNNTIFGNDEENLIDGLTGNDTLAGGNGSDSYNVDSAGDRIVELAAGGGGDLVLASVSHTLAANVERLILTETGAITGVGNAGGNQIEDIAGGNSKLFGLQGDDTLDGGGGGDTLDGGDGNDQLSGGDGLDVLIGGAGNDTLVDGAGLDKLIGGTGNDTYRLADTDAAIVELAGQGIDTIETTALFFSLDVPQFANIEQLIMRNNSTTDASVATGNRLNNLIISEFGPDRLIGGLGNDTLVGAAGADTLEGGLGNDTYEIESGKDAVQEDANEGTDTVRTALSAFSLEGQGFGNVENLQLLAGAQSGTGNSLNNAIFGNDDANNLAGLGGNDTLAGGKGGDLYFVESAGDMIVELADGGVDQVSSSASYVLAGNVENLILSGTGAAVGVGNTGANEIRDIAGGKNKLSGLQGNDTLLGGEGDDTLDGGDGNDLLVGGPAVTDGVDDLIGGAGNDTLINDGNLGRLIGGVGNDVYQRGNAVIVELAGQGIDTIETELFAFSFNDPEFTNIENLVFTDVSAGKGAEGIGNNLNNLIVGTDSSDTLRGVSGNDTLVGGLGIDLLIGGAGNDTYDIDDFKDVVEEKSNEGIDTIRTTVEGLSLDTPVFANIENLVLLDGVGNGKGNALNNVIIGNDGVINGLDGGAGNDTLIGGKGIDIYRVDSAGDKVVELRDGGSEDRIESSVSFTMPENIELLFLTAQEPVVGVGNSGNNLIVDIVNNSSGLNSNSKLSGLSGNDTLEGGAGEDTLDGGIGNDLLFSASTIFAVSDGVDVLIGGAGNDTLIDGDNLDKLIGGTGNDTYRMSAALVVELAGQGIDTIETELLTFSLDVSDFANIENLVFTSTSTVNGAGGTGNRLNNLIVGTGSGDLLDGGIGNDTLVGNAGVDLLIGGVGNDTYDIDNANDGIDENSKEGTDTVRTALADFSLDSTSDFANIENLQLLTGALNGTGNSLNNAISGNVNANDLRGGLGNDSISGNAGDDSLDGGGGIDRLNGGAGDDTYSVDNGKDTVVEAAISGRDIVLSDASSYALSANIEELRLLGAALNGTGNGIANLVFGNGNDNKLSGLGGKDTMSGGAGKDTLDGGDFNDLLLGELGEDSLLGGFGNDSLDGGGGNDSLVGGSGTDSLLGGDGNDLLLGGDGTDVLEGQAGLDTLAGGAGNDFYFVDSGTDLVMEGVGQGTDTVSAFGNFTITLGANVEILILSAAVGVGNASANLIDGSRFASGNNSMNGGGGNDTLVGGDGFDTMTGGGGRDVFAFTNPDLTPEFVTDFTAGKAGDRLDLSDLLTGFSPGSSNLADFIQFVNAAGNTIVQVDADGAANGANFVDACLLQNVTVTLAQATADGSLILT